jgi:HEAT repeat protein
MNNTQQNDIDELINDLKNENWHVRARAAKDLGCLDNAIDNVVDALIETLNKDEDSVVRINAAEALANLTSQTLTLLMY